MEDMSTETKTDRDYNDIIFRVTGATGEAVAMQDVIAAGKDWTDSELFDLIINEFQDPSDTDGGEVKDDVIPDDTTTDVSDDTNGDDIDSGTDDDFTHVDDGVTGNEIPIPDELQDVVIAAQTLKSEPVSVQPLIGVIDSGLTAGNADLDYANVTLGSDFVGDDANPLLDTTEGSKHGDHILGIIAAEQDNGEGIDGINDDAPLFVSRAIGSGETAEAIVEFVDAAIASDQPNAVLNLSLDLTQVDAEGNVTTRYEFTPEERGAIEYARQNGVILVVAAGNNADTMSVLGQASQEFDNIITVGAAQLDFINGEWQASPTDYSSYGEGLDVVAYGGVANNPVESLEADSTGTAFGSSVATAKVTGAISRIWAVNPDLSYRQIIDIVKTTATDLGVEGNDVETGAGLVNLAAAVALAKTVTPEDYKPESLFSSDSWSGEGKFTPGERAVGSSTEKVLAVVPLNSPGTSGVPSNAGQHQKTVSNTSGLVQYFYENGRLEVQPNGQKTWYWTTSQNLLQVGRGSRSPKIFQTAYNKINGTSQGIKPQGDAYRWGNGWTQKFRDKNGSEMLLMLEDGASEAFWMWHGNLGEYKQMNGATGHLGYPRSNEIALPNKPVGSVYQVFATENGKSRIHYSPKTGSVATWGSIGRQYTDLGGAYHWLGMPTRREYAYGSDTIFSDFEGGKIAHQKSTGKVEVLKPGETASWLKSANVNIELKPGSKNLDFYRGQVWETNGYKFVFQTDGNLVLYSQTGKALWATGTESAGANRLSVQADGNVVLYRDTTPLWATNTAGNSGAKFVIQTDGNLVVYSAAGKPIFNTGTHLGKEVTYIASANWIRDRNLQRFPDLHFSTVQSIATGKALDAGGANNGVYPHSSLNSANNYHQWGFQKVDDQYMIISKATGLALDGGGGQNGSLPYTHPDPNTNNPYQLWSVAKNGSGYQIVNKATGRALDAGGSNGNSIYMYPNPIQGNSYHQWKIDLPPTVEEILSRFPGLSFSTVQSVATGKALDSGGANNSVYPYPSVNPNNAHHQWGFYSVGDHYMLINKANGKALDGGGKNGELPYGYPNPQPTNNPYQLWKVTKNGSGYQIVNKATGRALDAGGSNGNSLYMHPNPISGNSYHQWNLNLPGTGGTPINGSTTIMTYSDFASNWRNWSEYTSRNPFPGKGANCTWYAHGRMMQLGYSEYALDSMLGHAGTWDNTASRGCRVISAPQVPSIAVWEAGVGGAGSVGHVAVVERINSDGSIIISESNWPTGTMYGTRTIYPGSKWPSKFVAVPKS
jgi:surface antigen